MPSLITGLNSTNYFICVSCFPLLKQSFCMYLLNNNRQWAEATKGEFNVPAQFPVTSAQSKISPYKISHYKTNTGNRVFSSSVCFTIKTKTVQSRYAPNKNILRNHRCLLCSNAFSPKFYCNVWNTELSL